MNEKHINEFLQIPKCQQSANYKNYHTHKNTELIKEKNYLQKNKDARNRCIENSSDNDVGIRKHRNRIKSRKYYLKKNYLENN